MAKKYTQDEFDALLAVKNPNVTRVGDFINTKRKIEFKCLKHNKTYQATPHNCLQGKGLKCCRSGGASKDNRYKAALSFDSKLSKVNPLIKRVGDYINFRTKTDFKCLIHNEIHQSTPHHCSKGKRLKCCSLNRLRRDKASSEFDLKLKKVNPLVIRISKYINKKTKIEFKCLKHNETHQATPSNCLAGHGLKCCASRFNSSLKDLLKVEDNNQTIFYTYSLTRYKKYVKFGIAKRVETRRDLEYGEEIFAEKFNTRLEAFVIEQACLKDPQLTKDCPEELDLNKWPGHTEVRKCSKETALARVNFYVQELETLGVKEFTLKYLNPSPYEKALLKRRSL
jgi:hypothetical protein